MIIILMRIWQKASVIILLNPDKLRTHAPAKYEFIQQRIMHGSRYISIIREDLTFEVYNLWPDYVYANRIKSVDITVEGRT